MQISSTNATFVEKFTEIQQNLLLLEVKRHNLIFEMSQLFNLNKNKHVYYIFIFFKILDEIYQIAHQKQCK